MNAIVKTFASLLATAILASILLAFTSNARALTYNEATDGDLTGYGAQPPLNLSLGINTISGHMIGNYTSPDMDSFDFYVPAGGILTSVTVVYTNAIVTGAPWGIGAEWAVHGGVSFLDYLTIWQDERESVLPNPGYSPVPKRWCFMGGCIATRGGPLPSWERLVVGRRQ